MTKMGHRLVNGAIILAGALLASAIMTKVTPDSSWLAFAGWTIFFLALQSPIFLITETRDFSCSALFSRLWRRR